PQVVSAAIRAVHWVMARTKTRSKKSSSGVTRSSERITAVNRRGRVETEGLTVPSLTFMSRELPALSDDEVHVVRLGSGDRAEAGRAMRHVLAGYLGTAPGHAARPWRSAPAPASARRRRREPDRSTTWRSARATPPRWPWRARRPCASACSTAALSAGLDAA